MVRPEGVLVFLVSLGFLAASLKDGRLRLLTRFVLGFAVIGVPYFAWRVWYFADLLPNTLYAKGALSFWKLAFGARYVGSYFTGAGLVFLACLVPLFWRRVRAGAMDVRLVYIIAVIATFLAYLVVMGGDHMHAYRMIVPMMPLLFVVIANVLGRGLPWSAPGGTSSASALGCALAVVLVHVALAGQSVSTARTMDPAAYVGTIIGRHVSTQWPAGSLVALNTAGSTPYYADDMVFIDMLGLCDRHIGKRAVRGEPKLPFLAPGHEKGDGAYVLERMPDFMILGPAEGRGFDTPWFRTDYELAGSDEFRSLYVRVVEDLDVSGLARHKLHRATASGALEFTYYTIRRDDQ